MICCSVPIKLDMEPIKTVEVHNAYWFTCEECGRDTYVRPIRSEISRQEAIDYLKKIGQLDKDEDVPDEVGIVFETYPVELECTFCHSTFKAQSVEEAGIGEYLDDDPDTDDTPLDRDWLLDAEQYREEEFDEDNEEF